MFQILCPLGHTLEIGAEHIGQRLMCPLCNAVVHTSPPRPGEQPGAKYEVQCSQGHILRVKRKYLGKEIRCPSCQQLVSMKPGMMLTSNGMMLSVTKPDAFKQEKKAKKEAAPLPPARKEPPPRMPLAPTKTQRIPPPPSVNLEHDTDDQPPVAPELIEDDTFEVDDNALLPKANLVAAVTVPDDDFEFEVVDTQFNMELKESGIDPIPTRPPRKKATFKSSQTPLVQAPPTSKPVPTGLHNLSGSEMMQVNNAALGPTTPPSMRQFNCPQGHLLEVETRYQGMHIQCPVCKVIFTMPAG